MQRVMTVSSPSGERFELDQRFNRGGEAEIWTIRRDPHLVAKLYHQPTVAHEAKLTAMLANPPQQPGDHPAIAWPLQLLYSERHFAGYLMPRVHESRPIFQFYNPIQRARMSESYPWRYFLHRAARNLASAVELVHKRGYVIGDLNESNVLVNRSALVTLVDVDSFQVQASSGIIYRSMVGKAEFTPPELQGLDFKSIDRNKTHDSFGLAVLIFYLLMEGYHPFSGVRTDGVSVGRVDLHGIRHGLFPYTRGQEVEPPPNAPTFMWLDPDIQRCFRRAFVEGHDAPHHRPSATEWQETLTQSEASLVSCRSVEKHIYASHLGRCPYCVRNTIPAIAQPPTEETRPPQVRSQSSEPVTDSTPRPATAPSTASDSVAPPIVTWWQLATIAKQSGWSVVQSQVHKKAKQQAQHAMRVGAKWSSEQSVALWRGTQLQVKALLLAIYLLPGQAQSVQQTLQAYGSVGQRWLIGNAIGSPVGVLAAIGGYQLALQGATIPLLAPMMMPLLSEPTVTESSAMVDQLLQPQWLWAICGLLFGATLGIGQAWALRSFVLRWHYLRELWIGVSALAGVTLGILAYGKATPAMALQPIWSPDHLYLSALVILFGAALGFLQSFILRQQLQRADDSRIWTVTNAFAWLLIFEGTLVGLNWFDPSTPSATVQGGINVMGGIEVTPGMWLWIGGWLGASLSLVAASMLTGAVLMWMLRGQRRGLYWHQLIIRLLQWRFIPVRLRTGTIRWARGLLLLMLLVLLLEGLLLLGQS